MKAKMAVMFLLAAVLAVAGWSGTRYEAAAAEQIGGHKVYIGVAADTTGLGNDAGDQLTDKTTGKTWIYSGTAWVLKQVRTVTVVDTLTAPGAFPAVNTAGYTQATFIFSDSLVATSATVQYEGKALGLSPLDWFILDAEGDSSVYAGANGTWAKTFNFASGMDQVRQRVKSEAGGTAGKFWSAIILGNPNK